MNIHQVSLANYVAMKSSAEQPRFRIVYSKRSRRVSTLNGSSIAARLINLDTYEEMAWGSDLEILSQGKLPVIVILERNQVRKSKWLTKLMYQLYQDNLDNTLLIFCAEDTQTCWNSQSAEPEQMGINWYPSLSQLRQTLVHDVEDAAHQISTFVQEWYDPQYLIGVSYAHYDPQDENSTDFTGDIAKLKRIVDALKSKHRERSIFFDQYYPAHYVFFGNNGHEKSWNMYRQCKLFLVLYNFWTKESENCIKELEVILDTCRSTHAQCVYLQSSQHENPPLPCGCADFPLSLEENLDTIVYTLEAKLNEAE